MPLEGRMGDLGRALFRPTGVRQLMKILQDVASVHRVLDEEEKIMRTCVRSWGIRSPEHVWSEKGETRLEREVDLIGLRRKVEASLALHPPAEQAGQLVDVLRLLFPGLTPVQRAGRRIFLAGSYYSESYAAMVCEKSRALNLWTLQDRGAPASTGETA